MSDAFLGYTIFLAFAVILIAVSVYINKRFSLQSVDEMLVAGRSMPFGLTTASVFVAWIWTTTIMGSTEAGVWYGVSGGVNYSWGSTVPFLVFIPVALRLRKIMPRTTTFVEFIRERFGASLANLFFVFGVALTFYVCIEQAVGIGIAFNIAFGLNYKVIAFLSSILFAIYIAVAGLRGSIYNSVVQFFIIIAIILITVPLIVKLVGLENIYYGYLDAVTNRSNPNYNPQALNLLSSAGIRYGSTAAIVTMGQVILSQGYYSTAAAASSRRNLMWSYLVGTVLAWLPLPIIFGNVMGGSVYALKITPEQLSLASGSASYIFQTVLGNAGSIAFVILIFMAGLTTGGNGLAGTQAMFTVDLYKRYINHEASETQQTKFGQKATVISGVLIGICAAFLEGISLLKIDLFSGILFAAPTATLIVGLWSKKINKNVSLISILAGLGAGLSSYILIKDPDLNWFYGNIFSLGIPFIIIILAQFFTKSRFDFNQLMDYRPDHEVHLSQSEKSKN